MAKVDHQTLASLPQKDLEDLVQDVVRECEREGYAPDYVQGLVKGAKSWLKHNDRELKRDVRISNLGVPVTLENEAAPEPHQVQEVLSAATARAKVSASFLAFSGVRPEVLGSKGGTRGLVLGDLPDLDLKRLEFRTVPAQVIIRRELSKMRHQYFSYLNQKGAGHLVAYLRGRRDAGETLTPDSPVIKADEYHKKAYADSRGVGGPVSSFICTGNISEEVKRAIRRAGYDWRPYLLRSYFDSNLLAAELQGRMTSTARAFFMGHKGDIERRYTLNKHQLPRQLAEA